MGKDIWMRGLSNRCLFILLFLTFYIICVHANDDETKTHEPTVATFGVYVMNIHSLDLAKNSFDIGLYAWWDSGHNFDYDPLQTVEIINAYEFSSRNGSTRENVQTSQKSTYYTARIRNSFDVKNFPFDKYSLDVMFEDNMYDINSIKFVPDVANSSLYKNLYIPGWRVASFNLSDVEGTYDSNFGDTSLTDTSSTYSRIKLSINIERDGWRMFVYAYMGFFISIALCVFAFFIPISDRGSRGSLITSAVFTAVGGTYVLNSELPISHSFGLPDAVQLAAFGSILFTTIVDIKISKMFSYLSPESIKRINNYCAIGIIILNILYISYYVLRATGSLSQVIFS